MPAPVVHINGHPGSGKRTIATALQGLMPGARLLDNHTLLNPALSLFDRTDQRIHALRGQIRAAIFSAACDLDPESALILTDALDDSPHGRDLFDNYIPPFIARTARPLHRFILTVGEAENIRRLLSPDRETQRKLMDPKILVEGRDTLTLLDDDQPDVTKLDVTDLSADAAAQAILRHLGR